jgi:hypothetical protein
METGMRRVAATLALALAAAGPVDPPKPPVLTDPYPNLAAYSERLGSYGYVAAQARACGLRVAAWEDQVVLGVSLLTGLLPDSLGGGKATWRQREAAKDVVVARVEQAGRALAAGRAEGCRQVYHNPMLAELDGIARWNADLAAALVPSGDQ